MQSNITQLGNLIGLVVNSSTLTNSIPVSLTQTWNNSSIGFKALEINVTRTSSLDSSYLIDARQGGVSRFSVDYTGNVSAGNASLGNLVTANYLGGTLTTAMQPNITAVGNLGVLTVTGNINASNAIISGSIYGPVQGVIGGITPNNATFINLTANTISGNGGSITNLNGTNIVNATIDATTKLIKLSNAVATLTAASAVTVTASAQPAITSVGNLGTLNVIQTFTAGQATVDGTLTAGVLRVGDLVANGEITANSFRFKAFYETVIYGGNTGTSVTPNVASGTIFEYTANSNFTLNELTWAGGGTSATIIIKQDATGNRVMTSTMKFAGNSRTLSTAAASVDIISVFYDGTTYYATLSKGYA